NMLSLPPAIHEGIEMLVETGEIPMWFDVRVSPLYDRRNRLSGRLFMLQDITERKRAEESLRESEEKFKQMVGLLPEVVCEVDVSGNILFVSQVAFDVFGYDHADFDQGLNILEMIASEDQDRAVKKIKRMMAGEELGSDEYLLMRKDRSKFPAIVHVSNIFDKEGNTIGFRGIVIDITERKRAEEARQYLAAIVESSHDAIIGKTLDGIITSWNKGAQMAYGYSAEEVIGRSISILVPPEHIGEVAQFLEAIGRGEAVKDYEAVRVTKDNRRINVLLTVSPIKDVSGRIVGASSIAQDITELKRMEEALEDSERRYRELADFLPQTIFEIDLDGRFTYANRFGIESTGYTLKDIERGVNAIELYIPEQRNRIIENIGRVLSGEKFDDHEYSILRKDGSTYPALIYSNAIMRDGRPVGVRGIVLDITERKKVEQMKTDFVSFISHQLRTPVASLMAYIDNMLDGITGELNSNQVEYLSEMRDVCTRNNRLIADLLNISRLERGVLAVNIHPVRLRDVVGLAVKEYSKSIEEKGLALNIDDAGQDIFVLADSDKLIEVLKNVIHNALKFTEEGSINIEMMSEGDHGVVKVRDTGAGMPEDVMRDLFKREKVLSGAVSVGGGAGLGLYIAKGFMQLQNGDITVDSVKGEGSTFTVTLPKK
ncbi:MAG: PAS domain S-box protein, partial [Chloroflexota bacterium]|nr:PAS domain S-box protein [Chloroflexota bacterium]